MLTSPTRVLANMSLFIFSDAKHFAPKIQKQEQMYARKCQKIVIPYLEPTFTNSLDDIAFYDFVSESGK